MDINKTYELWLEKTTNNQEMQTQLREMEDRQDAFYRELSFGTGGLRGVMGPGPNRMNDYTVGKITQGISAYLNSIKQNPTVVIAYDTRNGSKSFAKHAAGIFAANAVKAFLAPEVKPTPMLSYYIRELGADMGVVITASHNPKEYNGYKVYGRDGVQITQQVAEELLTFIGGVDLFDDVKHIPFAEALGQGGVHYIDSRLDSRYYDKVVDLVTNPDLVCRRGGGLRVVYSSLHGTGLVPVSTALAQAGFTSLSVIEEQKSYDGDFPTVPSPNPEDPRVFTHAIQRAQEVEGDLILATDPDCDRIGVMVRQGDGFAAVTGNQVGALLVEYLLHSGQAQNKLPQNAAVIKTIVTTDLPKQICSTYSVALFETLTGFKYIGELAEEWRETQQQAFVFGFEESCGYLAGDFVRDKDAVIAAVLVAEMALHYKLEGKTLLDALDQLYARYGCYHDKLTAITLQGSQGQQQIARMMEAFRRDYRTIFEGVEIAQVEDFQLSRSYHLPSGEESPILLPTSDVLKIVFQDGSWVVMRPSGTEPKLKIYYQTVGATKQEAEEKLNRLEERIRPLCRE